MKEGEELVKIQNEKRNWIDKQLSLKVNLKKMKERRGEAFLKKNLAPNETERALRETVKAS